MAMPPPDEAMRPVGRFGKAGATTRQGREASCHAALPAGLESDLGLLGDLESVVNLNA